MLRDKNLIPLSRQHQRALALCVRLDRAIQAGEVDVTAWRAEIAQIFQQEIAVHFAAEEVTLFPAAARFAELRPLVDELLAEHGVLRDYFDEASAGGLDLSSLKTFGETLSTHIRKEERRLLEGMQQRMGAEELASLGAALEKELAKSSDACLLPNEATRLRGRKEL